MRAKAKHNKVRIGTMDAMRGARRVFFLSSLRSDEI